jgi:hypothetical protein
MGSQRAVAVQNTLPNHPLNAEGEWIRRFFIVREMRGFEPVDVVASADVFLCEPDCALGTLEVSLNLIRSPTLGLNRHPRE